jgi:nucleotide-binding universal stress UspA family protein
MFKRVVWATDGSPAADAALGYAKAVVAQEGAELIAIHVDEVMAGPKAAHLTMDAEEPDARQKIKQQVEELKTRGINATEVLATRTAGGAAHAIWDAARDAHADLIVVGTRGHTAMAGLLLGSVTQRLLHISDIPVLSIPPNATVATE